MDMPDAEKMHTMMGNMMNPLMPLVPKKATGKKVMKGATTGMKKKVKQGMGSMAQY